MRGAVWDLQAMLSQHDTGSWEGRLGGGVRKMEYVLLPRLRPVAVLEAASLLLLVHSISDS